MQPPKRNLLRSRLPWRTVAEEPFDSHGKVQFQKDASVGDWHLSIRRGDPGSGVNYRGPVPRMNYQVTAEARRVEGEDFFYGLTFPIGDQHATLIIGGWGGGVYGVSNLDGYSAVENETTGYVAFEQQRWYQIVLQVNEKRTSIELDGERIVAVIRPALLWRR